MGEDVGKEIVYQLSQEDLDRIAKIASDKAISKFSKEQKHMERRVARNYDKVRRTKDMLSSYRRMKKTLSEEKEFSEEEKKELRWKFIEDFMGISGAFESKTEQAVINSEKKRQENLYCIQCIENAVALYADECEKSSSEEEKRRYRELYALYIGDEILTVPEIAERERISEKTVYKDLGIAYKIVAVYLLGVES